MPNFETGATTAAANNLVLCVTNTGEDYKARQELGFMALAHGYDRAYKKARILVEERANIERAAKRGRFPAGSISEAARLILAASIDDAKASIVEAWTGEDIEITGRKWRDNVNGNTYHSVWIVIPTNDTRRGRIVCCPLQYGYGDQWKWTGVQALASLGFKNLKDRPFSELPLRFEFQGVRKKSEQFDGMRQFSF